MTFGSNSFSHQHVYEDGCSSLGRLQPGQRHCLPIFSSPVSSRGRCTADPSFFDHFFMQPMWKTVQQVSQDQTFDLRPTSFEQMAHSYMLCEMSSWIRVARSGAVDREICLASVWPTFCECRGVPVAAELDCADRDVGLEEVGATDAGMKALACALRSEAGLDCVRRPPNLRPVVLLAN